MKMEKWNAKVSAKLEELATKNGAFYCNRQDGVLFADQTGEWLLFCPGSKMLSANNGKNARSVLNNFWENALNSDGTLAENIVSGVLSKTKVRRFSDGEKVAYCAEKYLKMFPKNTLFYVESMTKPVIAGIWENGVLHIIGLVMPIYPCSEFVPA